MLRSNAKPGTIVGIIPGSALGNGPYVSEWRLGFIVYASDDVDTMTVMTPAGFATSAQITKSEDDIQSLLNKGLITQDQIDELNVYIKSLGPERYQKMLDDVFCEGA